MHLDELTKLQVDARTALLAANLESARRTLEILIRLLGGLVKDKEAYERECLRDRQNADCPLDSDELFEWADDHLDRLGCEQVADDQFDWIAWAAGAETGRGETPRQAIVASYLKSMED